MQQPCRACLKKLHCSNARQPTGRNTANNGRYARIIVDPATVTTNHRPVVVFSGPTALSMATGHDLLRRKLGATIFAERADRDKGKKSKRKEPPGKSTTSRTSRSAWKQASPRR